MIVMIPGPGSASMAMPATMRMKPPTMRAMRAMTKSYLSRLAK